MEILSVNKEIYSKPLEQALRSAATDRSLESYLEDLGLDLSDLKGKVLDLGSGRGENFSRQASIKGIEVISVNPMLVTTRERNTRKDLIENYDVPNNIVFPFENFKRIPDQKRSIAALAQDLPFQNESFNTIVSLYAVPLWLSQNSKSLMIVFKEIYRVLKPGGKAFLGPVGSPFLKRSVLNNLDISYQIKHAPKNERLKQTGTKIPDYAKNIYITKPLKESSI